MHIGAEQLLVPLWNAWVRRGGRAEAEPMPGGEGWVLRLSRRAKFGAWLFFLMFAGCLAGVVVLQIVAPQPPRQFWFLLSGFALFNVLFLYYVVFCHWYRVELNDQELILRRFLLPTRRIRWREITAFRISSDDDTLDFETESGGKLAIYLSLNGLSAVRRCLAAFALFTKTGECWASADPQLIERVAAWRCDDMDLEDDPFAPLGSWQHVVYEDDLQM